MLLIKKLAPLSMFHQARMKFTRYVGIGGIKLRSQWENPNSLIEVIQSMEEDCFQIQIFNPDNIIASKHLYYAVYFAEQAFALSSNISKNKSIEFLIYASFQRQIKTAINTVGVLIDEKTHLDTAYIVITAPSKSKISSKYDEILKTLGASPLDEVMKPLEPQRMIHLQHHFQISDFELENVLLCLGLPSGSKFVEQDKEIKLQALLYIVTERMAQLLMESFKNSN